MLHMQFDLFEPAMIKIRLSSILLFAYDCIETYLGPSDIHFNNKKIYQCSTFKGQGGEGTGGS